MIKNRGFGIVHVLLIVIVLVGGGAYAKHYFKQQAIVEEEAKKAIVENAAIIAAKKVVSGVLKDPVSAQFDEVRFVERSGAVCGQFNAKNSYGGYVGFKLFLVTKAGALMIAPSDTTGVDGKVDVDKYVELAKFLDVHDKVCKT